MIKEYTKAETAAFKAKRNAASRGLKQAMRSRGQLIEHRYPENATQRKRGFTPSGSAKLNFDAMRRMETDRPSINPKNSNRKPTNGSKFIFQVITHKKGELITKTVCIPEAKNKAGEIIRRPFCYEKPAPKFLHHERPAESTRPVFEKAAA